MINLKELEEQLQERLAPSMTAIRTLKLLTIIQELRRCGEVLEGYRKWDGLPDSPADKALAELKKKVVL